MARVVVIGAGAMGLAAAYRAAKDGHTVRVFEVASEPGGMAGHFDLAGTSIERFYHFICRTDYPTFDLLKELGIEDKLLWRATSMGLYSHGRLHDWGDPGALLRYPGLTLLQKIRYGIFAFVCVRRNSWRAIEDESARAWITRWCGASTYNTLWKPLFDHKFYEYAENISASWIWTRIRRIGRSRRSLFQEELGYLEGGSATLIEALVDRLRALGGQLQLDSPVRRVVAESGHVTGIVTDSEHVPVDFVICTVPTPLLGRLVPDLPRVWQETLASIHNIGVICVIFRLRRSVTPHFWVNISESDLDIPGVIEFTNLRPVGGDTIVYVPYYMPTTHPRFSWADEQLLDEAFACLRRLNPAIGPDDIIATKVARLRHGQPICEPGFAAKIPPTQTPIAGLQVADTCYYYPEDRGIAESVRLGRAMAMQIPIQTQG